MRSFFVAVLVSVLVAVLGIVGGAYAMTRGGIGSTMASAGGAAMIGAIPLALLLFVGLMVRSYRARGRRGGRRGGARGGGRSAGGARRGATARPAGGARRR